MAGIYIHIPFCKQACYYCDFHFSTNHHLTDKLSKAIADELTLQNEYLGNVDVDSIYFGGGTPSLLSPQNLDTIIHALQKNFNLVHLHEFTVEANPDDLTNEKLTYLKSAGVNRLSIGIQSFNDSILKFLNRAHSAAQIVESFSLCRARGFENISLDLIFAIPGQDHEDWKLNILKAIEMQPQHISAYSLTIEEKTVFGRWQKSGKLSPANEEFSARQFEILMTEMDGAGYEQYEISNFCRPGYRSRHNSSYWCGEHYLGVGPSAHSFNGHTRQYNIANNHLYLSAILQGKVPCETEVLSTANQVNEFIFTSLRTAEGCDLSHLKTQFNYDLSEHRLFKPLLANNLAQLVGSHLKLTRSGKLLADKIAADFFMDDP